MSQSLIYDSHLMCEAVFLYKMFSNNCPIPDKLRSRDHMEQGIQCVFALFRSALKDLEQIALWQCRWASRQCVCPRGGNSSAAAECRQVQNSVLNQCKISIFKPESRSSNITRLPLHQSAKRAIMRQGTARKTQNIGTTTCTAQVHSLPPAKCRLPLALKW